MDTAGNQPTQDPLYGQGGSFALCLPAYRDRMSQLTLTEKFHSSGIEGVDLPTRSALDLLGNSLSVDFSAHRELTGAR